MYSLIIVDYNSLEATIAYIARCREALDRQGASHVVIVENGENEGALALLSCAYGAYTEQTLPGLDRQVQCFRQDEWQVCYCHSGENMGYARGNNMGARIADALWKDPYYIISNNDLVFQGEIDLCRIERYFQQHSDTALLGPKIVGLDGKPQSPRRKCSAFCLLIGWYWAMALGGPCKRLVNDIVEDASEGQCDWVTGSFMFTRAEAFRQVGGFDPNTFLYAEEMIISDRFRRAGYAVAYCPAFTLVHNHGETVKKTISVLQNLRIGFESNAYYYRTYGGVSGLLLQLARWNFSAYTMIYRFKQWLKRIFYR